mgnify:CR=1 FL=1
MSNVKSALFTGFLSLISIVLAPTLGFAEQTRGFCDPQEDPNGCECTEHLDQLGYCNTIETDELVSTGDPLALKDAARVESWYNEDAGIWQVEADLTNFNGGAVMLINPNGGQCESPGEMIQYVSELTGIPRNADGSLPPFEYTHVGFLGKWNQYEEQWAEVNYNNIVWDSITNSSGDFVFVDTGVCETEPVKTRYGCRPDGGKDEDSDGGIRARAWSWANRWDFEIDMGASCAPLVSINSATQVHSFDQKFEDGTWDNQRMEYSCLNTTPKSCWFRVVEIQADAISIENQHFYNKTWRLSQPEQTYTFPWTYAFNATGGPASGITQVNAVCGETRIKKGKYEFLMNSESSNQKVDFQHPLCDGPTSFVC